jgi:hypothetical protein
VLESTRVDRRPGVVLAAALLLFGPLPARADDLPVVADVEFQPLSAQARRIAQTLDQLGQPLSVQARAKLGEAVGSVGGPPPSRRSRRSWTRSA